MGMIGCLGGFSPAMAQTSEPVGQLMRREVPFVWQRGHLRGVGILEPWVGGASLGVPQPERENLIQSDIGLRWELGTWVLM